MVNMKARKFFMGIDGGGTKTIGAVVDHEGIERARRTTSATNPNVVGLETTGDRLVELARKVCEDAGCSPAEIRGAVIGLAGGGTEEVNQFLLRRLRLEFGSSFPAQIETDARVALEGALDGGPGIVVIAGTGSVIIAKPPQGDVFIVGGWGRLFGDEGSGFYLGTQAVRAFSRLVDGLIESPVMSRLIAERLGWTTRDQLITAVYGEKIELSTLAPLVFELASMHEPIAIDILRRGVSALVELIQCARTRVNMSPVRAATIGGLIDTSTVYRELLVAALHEADPSIEVSMPVRSAVEGALMLALKGDSGEEKEQP